ncbi:ComEC/Rec2 family competence protein [Ancrocorticia sp.]|uniref:ComEC/Rec2 family competence protein n=1 Tax=Ancrocorticia sp. TaxID=2593684 RepID=UPI003F8F2082
MPLTGTAVIGTWLGLGGGSESFFPGTLSIAVAILLGFAALRRRSHLIAVGAMLLASIGLGLCHGAITHPAELAAAALKGDRIAAEGTISSRVSPRVAPWGEPTCNADVRLSGATVDGTSREYALVIVTVLDIPCDTLPGQHVALEGKARETRARERSVLRVVPASIDVAGRGTASERVVDRIDRSLSDLLNDLPEHAQGLIPGVALGDDSRVSPELSDAMRITGLTHLIAVSGGHISIVVAIVVTIVGRRSNLVAAGLCAVSLIGLVLLVGPHASVIRAVGMSVVVLAAMACGRGTGAVPALSIAVMATCWAFPWIAMGYGFWLSAAATAGIVTMGTPLTEHLSRIMPDMLAQAIAIPLAAQISCIPILMLFSEDGSVWAVVANALVAPIVAPLTVTGLIVALFGPICAPLALCAVLPAVMCTWWIDAVALALARAPGSGIPLVWAGVACLAMLALALMAPRWPMLAIGTCAVCLMLLIVSRSSGPQAEVPEDWAVVQCDVGQGSALIARKDGQTVMIDVGPEGDAAAQCVKGAGIDRLDLLILSHGHSDHIGGLPEVLDAVSVEQVWLSPNPDPVANTEWIHATLTQKDVPWSTAEAGQSAGFVRLLWPTVPNQREGEANAQSLAVHLDVAGGVVALADLPATSQERLVAHAQTARIVIMAHHGSGDQSARLAQKLHPVLTLISVGENTYGHPDPSALKIYGDSQIFDTQECGTISIDGSGAASSACGPGGEP